MEPPCTRPRKERVHRSQQSPWPADSLTRPWLLFMVTAYNRHWQLIYTGREFKRVTQGLAPDHEMPFTGTEKSKNTTD